jgi:hypothetical protein
MSKKHGSKRTDDAVEAAAERVATEPGGGFGEETPEQVSESAIGSVGEEGTGGARSEETARATGPERANPVLRGIYSGTYCLSYGVTFGLLAVGSLIPADSVVARGMRDGAEAAGKALQGGLRGAYQASRVHSSAEGEGVTAA